MAERSEYAPGTFCWVDLATTDQEAAKEFYGALFDWDAEDMPVGDGISYTMMRRDGEDVAAIAPQAEQQRDAGVPPMWNSYVSVDDVDAAARRAGELGATVHAPPFDVLEAGRMAVIQDPQGAFFMLWQPRQHIGARLVNAPGAFSWNELASPDLEASSDFYRELFGWTITPFEGSSQPYLTIANGERGNGGMRDVDPSGEPPNWLVYFATDDLDGTLGRVDSLGGQRVAGPINIGPASIAVVQDPQGAAFALYAGELEA